jgi:hypothetical protein
LGAGFVHSADADKKSKRRDWLVLVQEAACEDRELPAPGKCSTNNHNLLFHAGGYSMAWTPQGTGSLWEESAGIFANGGHVMDRGQVALAHEISWQAVRLAAQIVKEEPAAYKDKNAARALQAARSIILADPCNHVNVGLWKDWSCLLQEPSLQGNPAEEMLKVVDSLDAILLGHVCQISDIRAHKLLDMAEPAASNASLKRKFKWSELPGGSTGMDDWRQQKSGHRQNFKVLFTGVFCDAQLKECGDDGPRFHVLPPIDKYCVVKWDHLRLRVM